MSINELSLQSNRVISGNCGTAPTERGTPALTKVVKSTSMRVCACVYVYACVRVCDKFMTAVKPIFRDTVPCPLPQKPFPDCLRGTNENVSAVVQNQHLSAFIQPCRTFASSLCTAMSRTGASERLPQRSETRNST